jgi:hypothetical protein
LFAFGFAIMQFPYSQENAASSTTADSDSSRKESNTTIKIIDLKFRTVSKSTKDREEEDGSETKIIGKLL